MREVFSVNGQFTEESKKDLRDFVVGGCKEHYIWEDISNTTKYGRLSYVKQMSDFLGKLNEQEGGKYRGFIADLRVPMENRLRLGDYEHPVFRNSDEMMNVFANWSSFSDEKRAQFVEDFRKTTEFANLTTLENMAGMLKDHEDEIAKFGKIPAVVAEQVSSGLTNAIANKKELAKEQDKRNKNLAMAIASIVKSTTDTNLG